MEADQKKPLLQADAEVKELSEQAFRAALGAAIMSIFPVASIFAIFRGVKGLRLAKKASALATERTQFAGVKNIVARALSIEGIACGAHNTLAYLIFFGILALFYGLMLFSVLAVLFAG